MNTTYSLPLTIFREGKYFIAYSPALDLSSSGNSEKKAQENFSDAADIFFQELIEMGTLNQVLRDLGWTKQKKTFFPPKVIKQSMFNITAPQFV